MDGRMGSSFRSTDLLPGGTANVNARSTLDEARSWRSALSTIMQQTEVSRPFPYRVYMEPLCSILFHGCKNRVVLLIC